MDSVKRAISGTNWNFYSDGLNMKLSKLASFPSVSKLPLVITHCLTIKQDHTWELFVHGKCVDKTCHTLSAAPKAIESSDNIICLLQLIEGLNVCAGHPDEKFVILAKEKKGKIGKAEIDEYAPVLLNGDLHNITVRSGNCEILTNSSKCRACVQYRDCLRVLFHKHEKSKLKLVQQSPSRTHKNNRFMTSPEKNAKMASLRARVTAKERIISRLRDSIDKLVTKDSVEIDSEFESDLSQIMHSHTESIRETCPEESLRRILWEQQLQALLKPNRKQMKWHPLLIRWCLNLKLISSAAYHAIRTSGFLSLPSERTLRDYSNFVQVKSGYNHELTKMLIQEAKLSTLSEPMKHVTLVIDEMKIQENLVYNKHNGKIIGFVDIGQINNDLLELELKKLCESPRPPVANSILAIMVRGIFINLKFPYAYFPCKKLTAEQLFPIVWEAVERIEAAGLKVLCVVADGASTNRKFFKMHGVTNSEITYKTPNIFTSENRSLYFVSDPPHLIKTTRNCFSHSFSHGGTRKLWVNFYCNTNDNCLYH